MTKRVVVALVAVALFVYCVYYLVTFFWMVARAIP